MPRLFVDLLIALLFSGCTATGSTHQKEDVQGSNTNLVCPPVPVLCPQIFLPAKCSILISGKMIESSSGNICQARQGLLTKLCTEKKEKYSQSAVKCQIISE